MLSPEHIEALLLGVIQGAAEFLPISSSGHLVILGDLLAHLTGQPIQGEHSLQLNVALHVGTLFSILVVYRRSLVRLVRQPRLCASIIIATVPVIIAGLTFNEFLKVVFGTPLIAGCALLVTTVLLVLGQKLEQNSLALDELSFSSALAIGLFQAAALIPGISRSGSTIAGGLLIGLRREEAADFSFLIAIPAILGAATLTAADIWQGHAGGNSPSALILGSLTAFSVGVVSLRVLLRLVARRKLHWFAWYCAIAAFATIAWQAAERVSTLP